MSRSAVFLSLHLYRPLLELLVLSHALLCLCMILLVCRRFHLTFHLPGIAVRRQYLALCSPCRAILLSLVPPFMSCSIRRALSYFLRFGDICISPSPIISRLCALLYVLAPFSFYSMRPSILPILSSLLAVRCILSRPASAFSHSGSWAVIMVCVGNSLSASRQLHRLISGVPQLPLQPFWSYRCFLSDFPRRRPKFLFYWLISPLVAINVVFDLYYSSFL